MWIKKGKINIIIDGQFGSTGKGLISSYIGHFNHIDLAITNASPNAGHTFYYNRKKYIAKHLPVSGIINRRCTIYLSAGCIINPDILLKEMSDYNISNDRVYIHPRASIIEPQDIKNELNGVKSIGSTCSGVGQALIRKIDRTSPLAENNNKIKHLVHELDINYLLDQGVCCLMEVPQGMDLSINSGLSYPYCTSREITISGALSDAGIHPSYLGNVMVCIRTYPIRVGNIIENDKMVGYSGPFYDDSIEVSWDDIGVDPEYTTNTNRIRRVCTFSMKQYNKMMKLLQPTHIFLNFVNYLSDTELNNMLCLLPEITHLGFGKRIKDVEEL